LLLLEKPWQCPEGTVGVLSLRVRPWFGDTHLCPGIV
jgi:hypothetical protein